MRWPLAWQIFSLEARKLFSYRVDFWFGFLGGLIAELGVAYFLWQAIFAYTGAAEIGGYTFQAMIFYYIVIPLVTRIVRGQEMNFMAQEIYEGTLNRYLVYPLSFFSYKYLAHLAISTVAVVQLLIIYGGFVLLVGAPESIELSFPSFVAGLGVCMLGTLLYFLIGSLLEMVAFWQDNVWSLMVMLRFLTRFLGGGMLPLEIFPDRAQSLLYLLPFASMQALPARLMMGKVAFWPLVGSVLVMVFWIGAAMYGCRVMWRRGLLQYTGVGI